MCRMLMAVGDFEMSPLLDGLCLMAEDRNERHEENADKPFVHEHGWGIIYRSKKELKIYKSTRACFTDPELDSFRKLQTPFTALHARLASVGNLDLKNTHLFETLWHNEKTAFCHNGTIRNEITYDTKYQPAGRTDSEKYFYHLLSDLNPNNIPVSWRELIAKFSNYTAANAFLCQQNQAVAISAFTLNPLYYTMKISVSPDSLIMSSEILPNLTNRDWTPLKNGTVVQTSFTEKKWSYKITDLIS
ncbi:class II glutamine amidotransferase [bacterium]|nr:class II glutamine amidotransferase [bacterium]